MTHYKMNRLHLGCGESLATTYRRGQPATREQAQPQQKDMSNKRGRTARQSRNS